MWRLKFDIIFFPVVIIKIEKMGPVQARPRQGSGQWLRNRARFPQRGKLARLEAPLSFSLRSRNHARSASSHGLLHSSNPRPEYCILGALARRRPTATLVRRALRLISAMVAAALFKVPISGNLGCLP